MHLFHLGTKPHSLYSRAQGFIDSKITFSSIHRRYMAIMLKVLQGTLPMFLKFSAKKKKENNNNPWLCVQEQRKASAFPPWISDLSKVLCSCAASELTCFTYMQLLSLLLRTSSPWNWVRFWNHDVVISTVILLPLIIPFP